MPAWLAKLIELLPDLITFAGTVLMAWPPLKLARHSKILTGLLTRNLSKTKVGAKWGPQTVVTIRETLQRFSANDFANLLRGLVLIVAGTGLKVLYVVFR